MGWSRRFDDPIALPRGRQLVILKDAADYVMKLPKAEQNLEEWQTAIACLVGAAEGRDFLMHARIGMLSGDQSVRRTSVRSIAQRHALGTAEAKEGSIATTSQREPGAPSLIQT